MIELPQAPDLQTPDVTASKPLAAFMAGLPKPGAVGRRVVPKIVWMFWHAGLDDAPDAVRRSHATWTKLNPDHDVRLLTLADVDAVLGVKMQAIFDQMTVDLDWAGKSDVIRLLLLARFGGIWADATTFCLRPLSDWLYDEVRDTGFFCFRNKDHVDDHEMISWFIAASPGHMLITRMLARSQDFLFKPRAQNLTMLKTARFMERFKIKSGDRPGIGMLERCEKATGKTCSTWLFYIFKTVLENCPNEKVALRAKRNEHAQPHQPIEIFKPALVSKQTDAPQHKEIYAKRINRLFEGDQVLADFWKATFVPRVKHWTDVRETLAISEERKIVFIHIPKCGGTSIDRSEIFEGNFVRFGHDTLSYYRKLLGPRFAEFRILTVVRNPWDRLASAFHYLSQHLDNPARNKKYPAEAKNAHALLTEFDKDINRFLPAFCANPKPYLKALHFRPSVNFFHPDTCEVPYHIQKLEVIDTLEALRDFVGIADFELDHKRKGPSAPLAQSVYTDATFRRVGEIYAADVEAFGYEGTTIGSLKY